jgi:hypothetical protein
MIENCVYIFERNLMGGYVNGLNLQYVLEQIHSLLLGKFQLVWNIFRGTYSTGTIIASLQFLLVYTLLMASILSIFDHDTSLLNYFKELLLLNHYKIINWMKKRQYIINGILSSGKISNSKFKCIILYLWTLNILKFKVLKALDLHVIQQTRMIENCVYIFERNLMGGYVNGLNLQYVLEQIHSLLLGKSQLVWNIFRGTYSTGTIIASLQFLLVYTLLMASILSIFDHDTSFLNYFKELLVLNHYKIINWMKKRQYIINGIFLEKSIHKVLLIPLCFWKLILNVIPIQVSCLHDDRIYKTDQGKF